MYTPVSNIVVTAMMRWPGIGLLFATLAGFFSNTQAGAYVAWAASVGLATYLTNKVFDGHLCSCKENHIKLGLAHGAPKINWLVEYHEHDKTRPWHLYFMFDDDESTKHHYAAYSTEDHAELKKEQLEEKV